MHLKSTHFEAAQVVVLRRWIPSAFGLFIVGFAVSAFVSQEGKIPTLEQLIMSDLLSPIDSPRSYMLAVGATAGCSVLLLPVATFLRSTHLATKHKCSALGVWLYHLGLIALFATALSTPFQEPYVPVHVYLAFLAFMGMTAGLAALLFADALRRRTRRMLSAAIGSLQAIAWMFLAYVFLTPDFFDGRRWLLGLSEWLLTGLIGVGTILAVKRADPEPNKAPGPMPTSVTSRASTRSTE